MSQSTGFGSIVSSGSHLGPRTLWLVALLACAAWTIYYSYTIIWMYNYEPNFGVKIVLKPMREIPLPAITICSPVFAKNNLASYLKLGNIFNSTVNFSASEQNFFAANLQVCNQHDVVFYELVKRHVMNRTDFDTMKLLNESALTVAEIMPMCSMKSKIGGCGGLWREVLTDKGYCYSFNMQSRDVIFNENVSYEFRPKTSRLKRIFSKFFRKKSDNVSWTLDGGFTRHHTDDDVPYRALRSHHLTAFLNLSRENADNPCPIVGKVFRVTFHMPNEMPSIFHVDHFVAFDFQKYFILTATSHRASEELRKYPPKVRGCYFQDERELKFYRVYTKTACDLECLTNYTLESCGCVKFSMPHEPHTPICDIDQIKCYATAINRWPEENDANHIACNCLHTCNNIKYSVSYAKECLLETTKALIGSPGGESGNSTDTVVSASIFDHMITEHQTFISYTLGNLIADVGGLLGLFMGASFVTFLEIAHRIVNFALLKCSKRQKVEAFKSNDAEMLKLRKLSQVIQILDHKQKENHVKILNLEEKIEKLKRKSAPSDGILKSLEEIISQNRRQ